MFVSFTYFCFLALIVIEMKAFANQCKVPAAILARVSRDITSGTATAIRATIWLTLLFPRIRRFCKGDTGKLHGDK